MIKETANSKEGVGDASRTRQVVYGKENVNGAPDKCDDKIQPSYVSHRMRHLSIPRREPSLSWNGNCCEEFTEPEFLGSRSLKGRRRKRGVGEDRENRSFSPAARKSQRARTPTSTPNEPIRQHLECQTSVRAAPSRPANRFRTLVNS